MPHNALAIDYGALQDSELVLRAGKGEREAYRHILQRSNQRLFRIARSVLNDDDEAEDAVQEAYTHAFAHLDSYRGEASLLTWMTRIVLNVAFARLRQRHVTVGIEHIEFAQKAQGQVIMFPTKFGAEDPAAGATRAQMRALIEQAIDALPEAFRVVFVMREVEECSTEETAQALGIRQETVKTRLHRARRLLRKALHGTLAGALTEAFPFLGPRCERLTATMMARLPRGSAIPD